MITDISSDTTSETGSQFQSVGSVYVDGEIKSKLVIERRHSILTALGMKKLENA